MNRGCEERLSHCIICGARGFIKFFVSYGCGARRIFASMKFGREA